LSELKRFNLRMSHDLWDYYKEKADSMGVPVSNYIVMALSEYKNQRESIDVMSNVMNALGVKNNVQPTTPTDSIHAMASLMELMGKKASNE